MEVGAIALKPNPAGRPLESKHGKAKFSETLSDVQNKDCQTAPVHKELNKSQDNEELAKDIHETASFLKHGNAAEVTAVSMDKLEEVNLDGVNLVEANDLLETILEQLGISSGQIEVFMQKWSGNLKDSPDADLMQKFINLLSGLAKLPQQELANKLGKNDLQIFKALKLHALTLEKSPIAGEANMGELNELLQSIGERLTNQTEMGKSKMDFLQMRFTRLASELNQENSKNIKLDMNLETNNQTLTKVDNNSLGFLPQIGRLEQLSLMMNTSEKNVSAEQLLKQFESILSKSQFMNSGGTQKLFIKLFPEHLGSVRVELFQKDQTMIARIITTTGTAKEALESQLNGLKQAFAAQNISVERIEISQQSSQQERFLNKDQHQQHRQPDSKQQDATEEQSDFNLSFEEALLNTEA
jgi:flagellar hook-length control protein FliK